MKDLTKERTENVEVEKTTEIGKSHEMSTNKKIKVEITIKSINTKKSMLTKKKSISMITMIQLNTMKAKGKGKISLKKSTVKRIVANNEKSRTTKTRAIIVMTIISQNTMIVTFRGSPVEETTEATMTGRQTEGTDHHMTKTDNSRGQETTETGIKEIKESLTK